MHHHLQKQVTQFLTEALSFPCTGQNIDSGDNFSCLLHTGCLEGFVCLSAVPGASFRCPQPCHRILQFFQCLPGGFRFNFRVVHNLLFLLFFSICSAVFSVFPFVFYFSVYFCFCFSIYLSVYSCSSANLCRSESLFIGEDRGQETENCSLSPALFPVCSVFYNHT